MRRTLASTLFLLSACRGGSQTDAGSGIDGGPRDAANDAATDTSNPADGNDASGGSDASDAKPLPKLTSTVSDCGAVTRPCAQTDFGVAGHTISPLIFGDGIEWKQFGQNVLAPDATGATPGSFRPEVIDSLKQVGFTMMRYPGGTLADLFHWKDAIGPMASRKPQRGLDVDPKTGMLAEEMPAFGPDEFVDFAGKLGTEILLTVNVGTGTAQEAADWIAYWKAKKVAVTYVEIGNEMYLPGPGGSFPVMDPMVYAKHFDEYAVAIHKVDPAIRLGVLGTMETSSWCYPGCTVHPWNEIVLQNITEKASFMAVHNAYAPGTDLDSKAIYQAMLSYPNFSRFDTDLIEKDIDLFGNAANKKMPIAITEHASFFLPPASGDLPTLIASVSRNQNLASALYSALLYQGFVQDPRVTIVNHINPLHFLWQAPVTLAVPDFATYPASYDPKPTLSAFGLMFQGYRELGGQSYVPVTVARSPTIDTGAISIIPMLKATPLLDAVAARSMDAGAGAAGWMFVVNRSLDTDLEISVVFKNLPAAGTRLEIDQLTAPDYTAKNTPGASTAAVAWKPVELGLLPAGASFGTTLTVPKHTLLRLRVR